MSYFPAGVTSDNPVYIDLTTAMAATIDSIEAVLSTRGISEGTATLLTPKFKTATLTANTADQEMVALVASKKIRVLALFAMTTTDATLKLESSTTTEIMAAMPLGANGGFVLPFNPVGWCQSAAGESLTGTTTGTTAVPYVLCYVEAA